MTEGNRHLDNDRGARLIAAGKLLIILLVIVSLPLYMYLAHPELVREYADAEAIKQLLLSYRRESALVYLGLNVFQVVCSLPGQVFQLAGGYALGFWLALPLTIIGVAIGCSIAFTVSKKLGHDAIRTLFGGRKVAELLDKLDSEKGVVILFVAYLIPGMPKDLVNYVAGLTDIRFRAFLPLCMCGRLPGMMISLFIGSSVTEGNYTRAIIAAVCVLAAAGICLIKREAIIGAFHRFYAKALEPGSGEAAGDGPEGGEDPR